MREILLALALAAQTVPAAPRTIAQTSMSQVDAPRQAVARSQAEWVALWRRHAGETPAPAVDFNESTVVAVFLGSRMSSGYRVGITGTRREGATLVVLWSETRPDPGMMAAQVITTPAHLAAIPRFPGDIRFEQIGR
jgi:hypothetical protein